MKCTNNCYMHLILTNYPNHHYIKEITFLMKCYIMAIDQSFVILPQYPFKLKKRFFLHRNLQENSKLLDGPSANQMRANCGLTTYRVTWPRACAVNYVLIFGFSLLSLKVDIFHYINCVSWHVNIINTCT